jgi:hypothetical protein
LSAAIAEGSIAFALGAAGATAFGSTAFMALPAGGSAARQFEGANPSENADAVINIETAK